MKTKRPRYVIFIITSIIFCMLFTTLTIEASSKLVKLKNNKTYRYDINNDGKKERIKAVVVQKSDYNKGIRQTIIDVYINGKVLLQPSGARDCSVYIYSNGKNAILLSDFIYGDSATGHYAYPYKNKKYESVYLDVDGCFIEKFRTSNKELLLCGQPKSMGRMDSFDSDDYNVPFEFVATYSLSGSNLKRTKSYYTVSGKKNFTAVTEFSTSKKLSKLNVLDGVHVNKGDKVKLIAMSYVNGDYVYKIKCNKKTGWFRDSVSNLLHVG